VVADDIYASREATTYEIGYGQVCGGGVNLTPSVGLCNADGSALRAVLRDYGVATDQGWLDFDTTYSIAAMTPGMMSGAAYYHWVGIRGVQGSTLWVANSAPGYKGIWDNIGRDDFARLGGFSVVWLV
jgi:hypothetical protein